MLLLGDVATVTGLSWSWSTVVACSCVVVSWYLPRGVLRRSEIILKRLSEVSPEKVCLNERAAVIGCLESGIGCTGYVAVIG